MGRSKITEAKTMSLSVPEYDFRQWYDLEADTPYMTLRDDTPEEIKQAWERHRRRMRESNGGA